MQHNLVSVHYVNADYQNSIEVHQTTTKTFLFHCGPLLETKLMRFDIGKLNQWFNWNTKIMREICPKLPMKGSERQTDFKNVLMFPLLTLNK